MSLYRQFRLVAFAAVFGVAAQAQAQSPPPAKTTDSSTPADAASGDTTSMGRGNGSTSQDQGVTSLGAEAVRNRTASGSVALPARVRAGIDACGRMPGPEQIHSARCQHLASHYPAEFNPDGTARHVVPPE